jgi:hypothetical protein
VVEIVAAVPAVGLVLYLQAQTIEQEEKLEEEVVA